MVKYSSLPPADSPAGSIIFALGMCRNAEELKDYLYKDIAPDTKGYDGYSFRYVYLYLQCATEMYLANSKGFFRRGPQRVREIVKWHLENTLNQGRLKSRIEAFEGEYHKNYAELKAQLNEDTNGNMLKMAVYEYYDTALDIAQMIAARCNDGQEEELTKYLEDIQVKNLSMMLKAFRDVQDMAKMDFQKAHKKKPEDNSLSHRTRACNQYIGAVYMVAHVWSEDEARRGTHPKTSECHVDRVHRMRKNQYASLYQRTNTPTRDRYDLHQQFFTNTDGIPRQVFRAGNVHCCQTRETKTTTHQRSDRRSG